MLIEAFPIPMYVSEQGGLYTMSEKKIPMSDLRERLEPKFHDESWTWDDLAVALTDRWGAADLSELIYLLEEHQPALTEAGEKPKKGNLREGLEANA